MVTVATAPIKGVDARGQAPGLGSLIQRGTLLPMISGEALEELVLGGHEQIVARYATDIHYPLNSQDELHKVVKYQSLVSGWKDRQLKENYLNSVATHLYERAGQEGVDEERIQDALAESGSLTVSQFADRLGYPRFEQKLKEQDPLQILANLPLPIYLTTSPFSFIEEALRRAGKVPRSDFSRWHPGLRDISSVFSGAGLLENEEPCDDNKPGSIYKPCKHKPLVFHLYGLDAYPESLILTEDDYLTFLVAASQDRSKNDVDPVHSVVKAEIAKVPLLLLGYRLSSWAFRALYWSLIKHSPGAILERYCCIQLIPSDLEKRYLESYLRQDARFDKIFWEPMESFCQRELRIGL